MLAAGLLLLFAESVQLNAGAQVEARGGEAPLQAGEGPRATFASSVTPAAILDVADGPTTLRLQYRPRLFWRYPNVSDDVRPLVWHTVDLLVRERLSSTADWQTTLSGSAGELDYSGLRTILGPGQSALPQQARYVQGAATTALRWQATRRWQVDQILNGLYRKPLDEPNAGAPPQPGMPTPPALLRDGIVGWLSRGAYTLTPRGQIVLQEDSSYHDLSTGLRMLVLMPQVGWRQDVGDGYAVTLLGGVAITPQLHAGSLGLPPPSLLSPVATAAWDSRNPVGAGHELDLHAELGIDYYLDPVLERGSPRARVLLGVGRSLARDWAVRLEGGFATELTAHPYPGEPDQTVIFAALPVRYRVSSQVGLETGVRYSDRGPHLAADDFAFHQREIWGYVSVTALALPPPRPPAAQLPASNRGEGAYRTPDTRRDTE